MDSTSKKNKEMVSSSKKKKKIDSSGGGKKIYLDADSHATFIKCCIEEINKGNRPGSHFNRNGWKSFIANFNKRANKDYTKVQLKNHWDAMKKDWRIWNKLMRSETGLGWDPIRKTFDASPELWDDKIVIDPDFAKLRDKNLEMYYLYYDTLFQDTVATGEMAMAPAELLHVTNTLDEETIDDVPATTEDDENEEDEADQEFANDEEDEDDHDENETNGGIQFEESSLKRTTSARPSTTRGKKKKSSTAILKDRMDLALQALVNRCEGSSTPVPKADDTPTLKECMDMYAQCPGVVVGSREYLFHCTLFWRKEVRVGFMALPDLKMKANYMKIVEEVAGMSNLVSPPPPSSM